MPSEHYQRIRQAFNQPWPGNERCACGKPWPCPDAADSHSGVPVEELAADVRRRHEPRQVVTRGLFGSFYWECPVDGARSARDVPRPAALCDAMALAVAHEANVKP